MSLIPRECVTIIVVPRDRFSTTFRCLREIVKTVSSGDRIVAILGGAPVNIQEKLRLDFGSRVEFHFPERFLNAGESRQQGLKLCKTRLAVTMENDVYVREGWLDALVRCQVETGAALVDPLILEKPKVIHCAGNDLYVTYENGKAFAHKELRYYRLVYGDKSNLKRAEIDYGELHCQLVEVETALRLNVFDESLVDMHEVDAGLKWRKAGCKSFFEPESVVEFHLVSAITDPVDVRLFCDRWSFPKIAKSYQILEQRWEMDMTEHGNAQNWLLNFNDKVGTIVRVMPNAFGIWVDTQLKILLYMSSKPIRFIKSRWNRYKAKRLGFYLWPQVTRRTWKEGL